VSLATAIRAAPAPLAELGNDPLPTPQEALSLPFRAFPSWFLRITCDRCGKVTMLNEAHTGERRGTMLLRVLISRMRHEGCGGLAAGLSC
jgi:hypothetical protein